jgi:hypothetical protein
VRISAVWVDRGAGGGASSDDVRFVFGVFAVFVFVEPRFRVAMR